MIIQKMKLIKDKEINGNIIVGLAWGLIVGLIVGLAWGIIAGLIVGLAWGLIAGLGVGLAAGLAAGLGEGLVKNEFGLSIPIWVFFLVCLAISEIFFYFSTKNEKRKKITLIYVALRKLEEFFEVLLIVVNLLNIRWVLKNVDFSRYYPIIMEWFGYFGFVAIALLLIYVWLLLNKVIMKRNRR